MRRTSTVLMLLISFALMGASFMTCYQKTRIQPGEEYAECEIVGITVYGDAGKPEDSGKRVWYTAANGGERRNKHGGAAECPRMVWKPAPPGQQ
jgi:hypothetical protein